MRSQSKKGFSLIDLMVVIAVLSVTAAILVPRYLKHKKEPATQQQTIIEETTESKQAP